jgi:uncharacterized protein (TIGR03435 family)
MTAGWLRPRILLPPEWHQWDRETMDAVLAHERAHARRRDGVVSLIAGINRCIFWFHPLAWFLEKRLALLAEEACDEMTVARTGDRTGYAYLLLDMAEKVNVSRGRLSGCALSMAATSHLRRRIEALLDEHRGLAPELHRSARVSIALGATLLVFAAGGAQLDSRRQPTPKFDVAAIKLCKEEPGVMMGAGAQFFPGRLNTGCVPLAAPDNTGLIQRAYVRFAGGRLHTFGLLPIKGGPAWVRSDLYKIEAAADSRPGTELMQGPMLQALLEERFGLRIHRDVHPGPVYTLSLAKGASRLKPFVAGSCLPTPIGNPPPQPPSGQRYCKSRIYTLTPAVDAEGASLGEFAQLLSVFLDRQVIDRSGLDGRFDIHVDFSADDATPGIRGPFPNASLPAPDPNRPPIFTAIQEQLGLRLQAATGPVESLVIDHVERPSGN